jgi:hypothetical protein
MLDVYTGALVKQNFSAVPLDDSDVTVSGLVDDPDINEDDVAWLRKQYPEIEERHVKEHPASIDIRTE